MGTMEGGEEELAKRIRLAASRMTGLLVAITHCFKDLGEMMHEFLPPDSRQVPPMDESNGRWSDRRQTSLPWYQKSQQGEGTAPEATAPTTAQEKAASWLEGLEGPRSFGSRSTSTTDSQQPRSPLPRGQTTPSLYRSYLSPEALVKPQSTSSELSETTPKTPRVRAKPSPTTKAARTDSAASSGKSSLRRPKTRTK